jgi:phage-related protein
MWLEIDVMLSGSTMDWQELGLDVKHEFVRRMVRLEDIAYVQFKWPIGKPKVDYLRDSIWEVRSRLENRIARVLFAVEESQMILLHGFIKKTQQTPNSDIDLAIKRLKEWKHEHKAQNQ